MQFIYLLEWPVLAMAILILVVDLLSKNSPLSPAFWATISAVGSLVMLGLSFYAPGPEVPVFYGAYTNDIFAMLMKRILFVAVFLTSMLSYGFVKDRSRWIGEYYAILWFALMGMMFMVSATELIMLFVATETTTISLYILAGFFKEDKASNEAGLKYLLLGAIFSAIMIYGMALLYGSTGTLQIRWLAETITKSGAHQPMLMAGMVLMLVGFSFKIAAVPFHNWAPDVYQGAPTPITAFLSVASKGAGFAVLLRVFYVALAPLWHEWTLLLVILAALTMIVGNLVALAQRDIKRLLAYSSIAQAGYILVGAAAFSTLGVSSVMFYLVAYLFSNFGAFAVVVIVYQVTHSDDTYDYAGLGRRSPILALSLMLALLSLGGIPPLAGFFGKLYLFAAGVEQGYYWLVFIGILTSTVSVFYYLTVLRRMYIDEPKSDEPIPVPLPSRIALYVTIGGILILGVLPALAADWTLEVGKALMASVM